MEKGFVADSTYGAALQSAWTPGEPKPRKILGGIKMDDTTSTPISTYRCQRCGYLESYAPPA
jgi:hypothetical protein